MLEFYHPNAHETLKRNYLAGFIREEANRFKNQNYEKHSARYKLTAISYFGDWLKENGISLKKLQKSDVDRFLKEFRPRKKCNEFYDKCIHRGVVRCAALRVLSHSFEKYPEKTKKTAIQREIGDFAEHLDKNYGIAIPTIRRYKNYLEVFLKHHFAPGRRISMKKLTPRKIRDFILKLPPIKD